MKEKQQQGVGHVMVYSCRPTVIDYAHVGNFRAFLTHDVIKRWLFYRGYRVMYVTNGRDGLAEDRRRRPTVGAGGTTRDSW